MSTVRAVIDRIEEGIAVLELPGEERVSVPTALLEQAQEGDIVEITVIKKEEREDQPPTDSPKELFERLRRKSGKRAEGKNR